jgi:NTE family protein
VFAWTKLSAWMNSKTRIGIALSGGGVRGIAHLGVLKALNEVGIFPSKVSGSSAGAIVGAMYCQGYTPDEVFKIILETNYFKLMRPAISWKGLLKMENLAQLFKQYLPHDDFSKLPIPLAVAATDIGKGEVVYFEKGALIQPILASCSIPGMFEPIFYASRYLVDGGVLNNMPVEPLQEDCEVIFGANCNHLPEVSKVSNIKNLIERAVMMNMNFNVYTRKAACTYFIEPPGLGKFGVFDINKAPDLFQAGYAQAMQVIEAHPELQDFAQLSLPKTTDV